MAYELGFAVTFEQSCFKLLGAKQMRDWPMFMSNLLISQTIWKKRNIGIYFNPYFVILMYSIEQILGE